METNQNAGHTADAHKSNVEKFKVEYYYSNGFGETSDESEWVTDIDGLRKRFSAIFEFIERWLKGEDVKFQGEISEDVFTEIENRYGKLIIKFTERYRAGGYDDDPVFRYNDHVYVVEEQ